MKYDRVTFTGADDSIQPEDLIKISKEYPFVEWGILVSANNEGDERFPSRNWIIWLKKLALITPVRLSLHLCGRWVRELLMGDISVPAGIFEGPQFQRVQLNFHAERVPCDAHKTLCALLAMGPRQYIFQIDGANGNDHFESIKKEDIENKLDAVPLFDTSGGAGITPKKWPPPTYLNANGEFLYHGYAGGLGPENLREQSIAIIGATENVSTWIDMERRVRSEDDRFFDLAKVRRCLQIAAEFVD